MVLVVINSSVCLVGVHETYCEPFGFRSLDPECRLNETCHVAVRPGVSDCLPWRSVMLLCSV